MASIFVECYTVEDKERLETNNFTFLPELSNDEKFIFFNDGKITFSDTETNFVFHSNANV